MKLFVMDAFTAQRFGGNPAGVVLAGALPEESYMRKLAAELRYSETAFVCREGEAFRIRYFTPVEEVELCGHATIAAFTALKLEGLAAGRCTALTNAGKLDIDVTPELVWMDMATPAALGPVPDAVLPTLYAAFGLTLSDCPESMSAEMISTGLPDIIMPVRAGVLPRVCPDFAAITALSESFKVTGVHMFSPDEDCTARCRNFAPLFGIDEEAATGTSNGALTYYLLRHGHISGAGPWHFIQGEAMGRLSDIYTCASDSAGSVKIRVGGSAVRLFSGALE